MVLEELQISSRDERFEDLVQGDERVQQEFQELSDFLQHITDAPDHGGLARTSGVGQLGTDSQVARWRIRLTGPLRLEHVSAFRERLQQQPEAVDVRVERVTGGLITLRLTTGAETMRDQVEARVSGLRDSVAADITVEPFVPTSGE